MNKELTVLAIDTSTATMAGAICAGDQLLTSVQTEAERNHSIHIMTNIELMLKQAQLNIQALDRIVTGIGPGSYTGVRIAVTAAKTLAWIVGRDVVGVSSLAGLAFSGVLAGALHSKAIVFPMVDARRGQVYTAAFHYDAQTDVALRVKQDQIILLDDWCNGWQQQLDTLKQQGFQHILFVGDVELHQQRLAEFSEHAEAAGISCITSDDQMNGKALADLGRGRWLDECIEVTTAHELVPNYAQLTEAEVKQNAKEKEEGKSS